MSARLALHFLPHKPHGPAFHFGAGAPVVFPGVEAAGAASARCSQLVPAVEHKPLMEQRMAEQELVQAGIHRFWEAARTSSLCPVTTDSGLG